jgi:hypothetical protein
VASVDQAAFSERLGRNARYAAIGNCGIDGCMRLLSWRPRYVSIRRDLAIPALAALANLRDANPAPLRPCTPPASPRGAVATTRAILAVLTDRLIAFAVCAVLFHLANAAMLPIIAAAVTKQAESEAGLIIAACIVGPNSSLSPWAGRAAEAWGRRPILLLGFTGLADPRHPASRPLIQLARPLSGLFKHSRGHTADTYCA